MVKKIFDKRGFLNKEGKAFVNDNFTKAMKQVMATATSASDIQIIGSILHSLVGEEMSNRVLAFKIQANTEDTINKTVEITTIKENNIPNNVIPFPKVKKTTNIHSLIETPPNPD